jgi:hypothetical protein
MQLTWFFWACGIFNQQFVSSGAHAFGLWLAYHAHVSIHRPAVHQDKLQMAGLEMMCSEKRNKSSFCSIEKSEGFTDMHAPECRQKIEATAEQHLLDMFCIFVALLAPEGMKSCVSTLSCTQDSRGMHLFPSQLGGRNNSVSTAASFEGKKIVLSTVFCIVA